MDHWQVIALHAETIRIADDASILAASYYDEGDNDRGRKYEDRCYMLNGAAYRLESLVSPETLDSENYDFPPARTVGEVGWW